MGLESKLPQREISVKEYIKEGFILAEQESLNRIAEKGKYWKIRRIADVILKPLDFKEAKIMYDREAKIVSSNGKLTEEGLFRGSLYSLLTMRQTYGVQMKIYNKLLEQGFDDPIKIIAEEDAFSEIIKSAGLTQVQTGLIELAKKWKDLNWFEKINNGLGESKEQERVLRKEIMKAYNFGEKTSSLLLEMCGAKHLFVVDAWMMGMLYFHGYEFNVELTYVHEDKKSKKKRVLKRPPEGKTYELAEDFTENLADKYVVSPQLCKLAYWVKRSAFRRTEAKSNQLKLF